MPSVPAEQQRGVHTLGRGLGQESAPGRQLSTAIRHDPRPPRESLQSLWIRESDEISRVRLDR